MYSIAQQQRFTQRRFTQRRFIQKSAPLIPRYIICIAVAVFVLVPIITAVIGGFRTTAELDSIPFALPTVWHWENYGNILSQQTFWQAIWNSLITMLATVGLLLLIACPPAFVFARMNFRGREVLFNFFLIGFLFPFTMALLPLYITLRNLNLVNTLLGVILTQIAFGLPFSVLILRNFFWAIPQELEDATYIDGGSQVDFFWRVLLPLARPSLAVIAALTMVSSWNNFLLPLVALNDSSLWTLPLGVMQFQTEHATDWASTMAFVTLSMLPAIAFYLFAERYLISGLTDGALRG